MPESITFVVNAPEEFANFTLLVKALEGVKGILLEIDRILYGPRSITSREQWTIESIKSTAPTITLKPRSGDSEQIATVVKVFDALSNAPVVPSPLLTPGLIKKTSELGKMFKGLNPAESLSVLVDGKKVVEVDSNLTGLTQQFGVSFADGPYVPTSNYHDIGSLEGYITHLELKSDLIVSIVERVTDALVPCSCPRDSMTSVTPLFGKNVWVSGEIWYQPSGKARAISNVSDISEIITDPDLPKADFGSIPDSMVQEMGAAEWLRTHVRREESI